MGRRGRELLTQRWATHRNWSKQAAMLRSHDRLEHASARVVEMTRETDEPGRAARAFRHLLPSVDSHLQYQEQKLLPFLEWRWGTSTAALLADQRALVAQRSEVIAALEAAAADAKLRGVALERLEAHHALLVRTLAATETLAIPLLVQLSPSELSSFTLMRVGGLRELIATHAAAE